jgi:hypothetical protein
MVGTRKPNLQQLKYGKLAKERSTKLSQAYFSATLRQCEKAKADSESTRRVALRQCQQCYYLRSSIAGAGFTRYRCACCIKTCEHPNTCWPLLCEPCSKKHKACRRCGGDLNLSCGPKAGLHRPKFAQKAFLRKAR